MIGSLMQFWGSHGTKILGLLSVMIAGACSDGIVPESKMKYFTYALGVLTYLRGQSNTAAIAQAVIDKHLSTIADLQSQVSSPVDTSLPLAQPPPEK